MSAQHALRIRPIVGPISTDDIIPGRYKHMYTDPRDMAAHVFENRFPGYAATLEQGDALYCREIFGIGSSREQAVTSLLAAGVVAVFAPHFGRIFFRNAWNLGLLAIKLAPCALAEGERVTLDLAAGELHAAAGVQPFHPPPQFMLDMRAEGGLLARVRNQHLTTRPGEG
jgi:3-isopropylmalate/(R)-2-methylmalate dehydratase small subunit